MGIKIYKDGAQVANMPAVGRPLASQAEAEAGTDNLKQMTALRTAQAIAALGGGAGGGVEIVTEEYTGDGNAIEVVGEAGSELGAGAFASLASEAEAEAGTNNTKMMTPLRTAQAIAELASGGGGSDLATPATYEGADITGDSTFFYDQPADSFSEVDNTGGRSWGAPVDLTRFTAHFYRLNAFGADLVFALETSADTTNGLDGTWTEQHEFQIILGQGEDELREIFGEWNGVRGIRIRLKQINEAGSGYGVWLAADGTYSTQETTAFTRTGGAGEDGTVTGVERRNLIALTEFDQTAVLGSYLGAWRIHDDQGNEYLVPVYQVGS